jgi:hypothetical protein
VRLSPASLRLVRGLLVVLLILGLVGAAVVAVWRLVPRVSEETVRQTVLSTIQREAPASFLVTGTLDATATVTVRNTKTLLPGVLDLSLGTSRTTVRVPGRIGYGFDVRTLTPEHVRVGEDGTVEVAIPDLRVFSVEPNLGAMQVQTRRGWARSQAGAEALEAEALRRVQTALRQQGNAYLRGRAVQARTNTAEALEAMLRPALAAAGVAEPRFRFRLTPEIVRETG